MKRKRVLSKSPFAASVLSLFLVVAMLMCCKGSDDRLITVLNPAVSEELAERVPLAPRLDTLEGKTIYLVDMNYEGILGTPVMGEMQAWFAENMPGVQTVLRLKRGNYVSDDPELWKEIAENGGDAVVMGVAG